MDFRNYVGILCIFVLFVTALAGNAGRQFAVSLPSSTGPDPPSELVITAMDHDANVNLTGFITFIQVHIPARTSFRFNVPGNMKVSNGAGIQFKVIYVDSDEPVTVYNAEETLTSSWHREGTMARPKDDESYVYLLSGCPAISYSGCYSGSRGPYGGFYVVSAYGDDTEVDAYIFSSGVPSLDRNFTLNRMEAFDRSVGGRDWHGYVVANKPVSVYSGNACYSLHPEGQETSSSQYTNAQMPSVGQLGRDYHTFPVAVGDPRGGYVVRVTASEDDTHVEIPDLGLEATLDLGENHDFFGGNETWESDQTVQISCSKPCLAVQFGEDVREHDQAGYDSASSMFMAVLTPSNQMNSDLQFDTPTIVSVSTFTSVLALVVEGYPPQGDLFIDDELVQEEEWQSSIMGTHSSLTRPLFSGFHHIYTNEEEMEFAAYMYSARTAMAMGLNLGWGNREDD